MDQFFWGHIPPETAIKGYFQNLKKILFVAHLCLSHTLWKKKLLGFQSLQVSYLSGAKAPSSPPLAVQPFKWHRSFIHAFQLDQGQQGVAGRLQREQSVLTVRPVAATWRKERGFKSNTFPTFPRCQESFKELFPLLGPGSKWGLEDTVLLTIAALVIVPFQKHSNNASISKHFK